ncbi:DUF4118 domain-containing protein [Catellatospora sp. NPDC049133]|jgi:hypothetical protein|uniref:DUF4118 domain-containing protein n=1 Tax=Catellatospora sp. NPDC049133 TaxID=3155499 RepID=UPI0033E42AC4
MRTDTTRRTDTVGGTVRPRRHPSTPPAAATPRPARSDDRARPRTPFGVSVGIGAAAMTAATILAATLTANETEQLLIVALAVGGYAATVADTRASLVTALLGFGLFNGFIVNRYGELSFDGTATWWNLSVFAVALGLGLGQRWLRHVRDNAAAEPEVTGLAGRRPAPRPVAEQNPGV